jgi:hypothetical protein
MLMLKLGMFSLPVRFVLLFVLTGFAVMFIIMPTITWQATNRKHSTFKFVQGFLFPGRRLFVSLQGRSFCQPGHAQSHHWLVVY